MEGEGPYRVKVWCPDCCGEDPQGCFDGGVSFDEEEYPNLVEAVKSGEQWTRRNIWQYEVVDQEGKEVEIPDGIYLQALEEMAEERRKARVE